jgi:hypothetical protein
LWDGRLLATGVAKLENPRCAKMNDYNPQDVLNAIWRQVPDSVKKQVESRDAIYVIESPNPEDLLFDRHEGNSLASILKLGGIDVFYYLAANEETFEQSFKLIAETIRGRPDFPTSMPWIHISAHGGPDGLELTDGGVVEWQILTRMLTELHQCVGAAVVPLPMPQALPKASLCLSSCGAFEAYRSTASSTPPFQCLVGAVRDVGWCQALIAFSSFYYLTGTAGRAVNLAVVAMNMASGALFEEDGPAFQSYAPYNEIPWSYPPSPQT